MLSSRGERKSFLSDSLANPAGGSLSAGEALSARPSSPQGTANCRPPTSQWTNQRNVASSQERTALAAYFGAVVPRSADEFVTLAFGRRSSGGLGGLDGGASPDRAGEVPTEIFPMPYAVMAVAGHCVHDTPVVADQPPPGGCRPRCIRVVRSIEGCRHPVRSITLPRSVAHRHPERHGFALRWIL